MILTIENLFDEKQLSYIDHFLQNSIFYDGKETAGYVAQLVKDNKQLKSQPLSDYVSKILLNNSLFCAYTVPKYIHNMLFSKTEVDGKYGWHVDNAFMGDDRADVSFTIFLDNPSDYNGGELEIDSIGKFKLNKGDMIIYPSTTLQIGRAHV